LKKSVKVGIIVGIAIAIVISILFPVTKNIKQEIGNPASQYCLEHGGLLAIRSSGDGNQEGICQFPDGSECEEWQYFKGECHPTG
jgi:putative hemolysin